MVMAGLGLKQRMSGGKCQTYLRVSDVIGTCEQVLILQEHEVSLLMIKGGALFRKPLTPRLR